MNAKPLRKVLPILLLIVLPSCAPVQTQTPSPLSPTPPATLTAISPTATPTSLPSPTPTLALTPTPESSWTKGIDVKEIKGEFSWQKWSPTANEVVYNELSNGHELNPIIIASSPDFRPRTLYKYGTGPLWSGDGKSIYFSGPMHPEIQDPQKETYSRSGWVIDRNGENPVQFTDNPSFSGHLFTWEGWLNPITVVTSDYIAGGHYFLNLTDMSTQKSISQGLFYGGDHYIGKDFVAINSLLPVEHPMMLVFGKNLPVQYPYKDYSTDLGGNFRIIPIQNRDDQYMSTCFDGWMPGTNRMLVDWGLFDDMTGITDALYWWDADQNLVTKAVENAVSGQISPDGKILAFITKEPELSTKALSSPGLSSIDKSIVYLHKQDLQTGQITLTGIPVYAQDNGTKFCNTSHPSPFITFSPDSHYLTIETGQELALLPDGTPSAEQDGKAGDFLYLLDLQTEKITWSRQDASHASWSPDGTKLLIQNGESNWEVLYIDTLRSVQLTRSPVAAPDDTWKIEFSWSFDSQYLMMVSREEEIAFIRIP
jgi:dipeptidyl aminopeptidase/acylaminoacyl peptidase